MKLIISLQYKAFTLDQLLAVQWMAFKLGRILHSITCFVMFAPLLKMVGSLLTCDFGFGIIQELIVSIFNTFRSFIQQDYF